MSSLADLRHLTGFFSYSREDDQGSNGALSALREAIQEELSAQLGRTREDFRIWQDRSAISLGTLWEKQISCGIDESVFFIPIITPRVLKSHHCGFEFRAFLRREAELGRDDLVFPILYIAVPELKDEKLWRQDPVLAVVGTRQYLDWQGMRHREARSFEVQEKLEWYCRGITTALHKPWIAPNTVKSARDETVKTSQPSEPDRGAEVREDEKLVRTGETLQPRTGERSQEQIGRAQRKWAFPWSDSRLGAVITVALTVLIVGSVAAWFALWPRPTKPTQIATTIDTKLADTPKPPLALNSPQPVPLSASTPVAPPASMPAPDEAAWTLIHDSNDAAAFRRFAAEFPNSARRNEAEARLQSLLTAEAAWNSVRDSKDADGLRKFILQYPESARRDDAQARLSSLFAAQAAWNSVRDSKDPDQLRQFVLQFPESAERSVAEQRIASLVAMLKSQPAVSTPDPHELTRSLQIELQRVGCFNGAANGEFDEATKAAWHRFIKLTSISMPDDLSSESVNAVHGVHARVCPLECAPGKHAEGELCVANTPPAKPTASKPAPARAAVPRKPATSQAPAPAAHSNCFGTMTALSGSAMSRETCGY